MNMYFIAYRVYTSEFTSEFLVLWVGDLKLSLKVVRNSFAGEFFDCEGRIFSLQFKRFIFKKYCSADENNDFKYKEKLYKKM